MPYDEKINLTLVDKTRTGFASVHHNLDGLDRAFRRFAPAVISTFSVGAVTRFVGGLMKSADEVDNLRQQLDTSAETAQSFQVLAKEYGVGMDMIVGAFARLQNAQAEAIQGNAKQQESFRALGISVEDLKSLSTEQLFERVARAAYQNGNNAGTTAAKYDLLGRTANRLNGVLNQVARDGIKNINEGFIRTGQIVENNVIAKLDKAQARWDHFSRLFKTTAMTTTINTAEGLAYAKELISKASFDMLFPVPGSPFNMSTLRPSAMNSWWQDKKMEAEGALWGMGGTTDSEIKSASGMKYGWDDIGEAISMAFSSAFRSSGLSDAMAAFFSTTPIDPVTGSVRSRGQSSIFSGENLINQVQTSIMQEQQARRDEDRNRLLKDIARNTEGGIWSA